MASLPFDDSPRGFWHSLINFEHRLPTPADFKLDRMRRLLALLDNPEKNLRVIHIAGSKGKGSTSAMLHSALHASGFLTGLFTSPHLKKVEERIRVGMEEISPLELDQILEEIRDRIGFPACERLGFVPTYFEVATAAGFLHFRQKKVDLAVMETGLGGRLDATNVCQPIVTIITSISFDHQKPLGNTLAEIAGEKAGIIKPGVPVISGAQGEAAEVVRQRAGDCQAPLLQDGKDFSWSYSPGRVEAMVNVPSRASVVTPLGKWDDMEMPLLGRHQAANMALAVTSLDWLKQQGWELGAAFVRQGLKDTVWPGRMELAATNPLVVLDCAHNSDSIARLVACLQESFPPVSRTLIFGASFDKDISAMFQELAGNFHQVIFTQSSKSPRAAKPEELAKLWVKISSAMPRMADSLEIALRLAKEITPADGMICIAGSVFLAGEFHSLMASLPSS